MSRIVSAMATLSSFLFLVESYCAKTGLAEATISTRLFNDGKRLDLIRSGGDLGARKLDQAMIWLSDHWPVDIEWPADIPRPQHAEVSGVK